MAAISITASAVLASTSMQKGVANAATTITQGQVLYTLTNGTVGLADADGIAPLYTPVGIALNAASAGQPVDYVTSDPNFTLGATILSGDTLWLSPTAGGITKTIGDLTSGVNVVVIGVMTSTTTAIINFVQGGVKA